MCQFHINGTKSALLNFDRGRPDLAALFRGVEMEASEVVGSQIGCFVCGPNSMMESVTKLSLSHKFQLHKETFEL